MHLLLIIIESTSRHLCRVSRDSIELFLRLSGRSSAISPMRGGWWAYFRKLGTEIRVRGPRLSGYRSLRRNAEIRACTEGRESGLARARAFRTRRFRWRESAPRLRAGLFITCRGRFWSRAKPFFLVIVMCHLILAAPLPFRIILGTDTPSDRSWIYKTLNDSSLRRMRIFSIHTSEYSNIYFFYFCISEVSPEVPLFNFLHRIFS